MLFSDIEKLKQISKEYNIPIITDEVRDYLLDILKQSNYRVLEIGGAIGYSSFCMSLYAKEIVTIEKDVQRFDLLKLLISDFDVKNVIPINDDALNVELDSYFDLIFIDAAKSKNIEYFLRFSPLLNDDGLIITDNIFFHNLNKNSVSKNTKKLLEKIDKYKEFLNSLDSYETTILSIGDGLSITKKKKSK